MTDTEQRIAQMRRSLALQAARKAVKARDTQRQRRADLRAEVGK